MKIAPVLAILGVLALQQARADLTISQQIQQEGGPKALSLVITTKVKGDKARMDINPEVSSIIDLTTSDAVSLFHPAKKAMKIPGAMLKNMQQAQTQKAGGAAISEPLKATGKKETINGFACEEYETTAKGAKVQAWFTKDAPEAQKIISQLSTFASESDPFGSILKQQGLPGFPIQIVVSMPDGSKLTSTVTSLNPAALPDADFSVPADYQEVAMPTRPPGQ